MNTKIYLMIRMIMMLVTTIKISSSFTIYNTKNTMILRNVLRRRTSSTISLSLIKDYYTIHPPNIIQSTYYNTSSSYSMKRSLCTSTTLSMSSKTLNSNHDVVNNEETLFALSSGGGSGGSATAVAVIRITGPESHDALRILLSKTTLNSKDLYKKIKLPKPRYASLRMLYDPSDDDRNSRDPLDSSLILLFQSPSSFTGQDMVEIHSHGSRAVVQGVLNALTKLSQPPYNLNIRPADRGEFTQRAYGSGKLGLVEVEALADLIVADTSYQRLQALRQMDGRLSKLYEGWREDLIKGLAHAEAVIDFGDDEDLDDDGMEGDDDSQMNVWGAIRPRMDELKMKMERHLADAQRGEILRDGVKVRDVECSIVFNYDFTLLY